jgi:hypothetical protein
MRIWHFIGVKYVNTPSIRRPVTVNILVFAGIQDKGKEGPHWHSALKFTVNFKEVIQNANIFTNKRGLGPGESTPVNDSQH